MAISKSGTQPKTLGAPFWQESGNLLNQGPSFPLQTFQTGFEVAHDETFTHQVIESNSPVAQVQCLGNTPACNLQRNKVTDSTRAVDYSFYTHSSIIADFNPYEDGLHAHLDKEDPAGTGWIIANIGVDSTVTYDAGTERIILQSGPLAGNSASLGGPIVRDLVGDYKWAYFCIKNLKFTQDPGSTNGEIGNLNLVGFNFGGGNFLRLAAFTNLSTSFLPFTTPASTKFLYETDSYTVERDYQVYFNAEERTVWVFQDWEPLPRSVYQAPLFNVTSLTTPSFVISALRTAGSSPLGHTASFESVWTGIYK